MSTGATTMGDGVTVRLVRKSHDAQTGYFCVAYEFTDATGATTRAYGRATSNYEDASAAVWLRLTDAMVEACETGSVAPIAKAWADAFERERIRAAEQTTPGLA